LNTVSLSINEGQLFSKASAAPLFLADDNIFQKSASVVQWGIAVEFVPRRPIFENVLLFEKKGVRIFPRVCMAGCMGRISHTHLKNRMVIPESQLRKITY
jgi:hypothetical protein